MLLENLYKTYHVSSPDGIGSLRLVPDEALLAQMAKEADVHELFEWLRGLSFIESGQVGLFPRFNTRSFDC